MSDATTTTTEAATRRTTGKADKPIGSKFDRLYALASKGTDKRFTVQHKDTDRGTIALKVDGFPATLTAGDIITLSERNGGKVSVKAPKDAPGGYSGSANVGAGLAGEMARTMLAE